MSNQPCFDVQAFMHDLEDAGAVLRELSPARSGSALSVSVGSGSVVPGAEVMLRHGLYLVFVTAVHVSPDPEIVYQFAHYENPCRVTLQTRAVAGEPVPSIAGIYQGADWHEREIHDFFGIEFSGHPHLKPLILSRGDRQLRPLLKETDNLRKREDVVFFETAEHDIDGSDTET